MKFIFKTTLVILFFKSSFSLAQDILWEKSFGGKEYDILFDGIPTPDYGFLLGGSSISGKGGNKQDNSKGNLDYCIWKMDEQGQIEWQKSFGGKENDILKKVKITNDGGFILAGCSNSDMDIDKKDDSLGGYDFWIIKLDAEGKEMWQLTLGSHEDDFLEDIILTKDGGFLIGGSSNTSAINSTEKKYNKLYSGFGSNDYWIIKLNSKGEVEWENTFGGNYNDELKTLLETKDYYYLGGYSNSLISGNKTVENNGLGDYFIIKIDKKGEIIWQNVYGGLGDDSFCSMIELKDKNLLIFGNTNSDISNTISSNKVIGSDFWVIKIDPDGTIIWQDVFDYGREDIIASVIETEDLSLLVGGYSKTEVDKKFVGNKNKRQKEKNGINDYVGLKLNSNGEKIWDVTIGSEGDDVLKKIFETRDGGYLFMGSSNGEYSKDRKSSKGSNDYWIVKLKDKIKPEKTKITIEAFPNPTYTYTNVVANFEYSSGKASLFDLSGRLLKEKEIKGEKTIPFDLSNYPTAIYIIEIKTNTITESIKIIKN